MREILNAGDLLDMLYWKSLAGSIYNFHHNNTLDKHAQSLFEKTAKEINPKKGGLTEEAIKKLQSMKVGKLNYEFQGFVLRVEDDKGNKIEFSARTSINGTEFRGEKLKQVLLEFAKTQPEKSIYDALTERLLAKSYQAFDLGQILLNTLFVGPPKPVLPPAFQPALIKAIDSIEDEAKKIKKWTDEEEALLIQRLKKAFNRMVEENEAALLARIKALKQQGNALYQAYSNENNLLWQHDNDHPDSDKWYVRRWKNLVGSVGGLGLFVAAVVLFALGISVPIVGVVIVGLIGLCVGLGAVIDFRQREKEYGEQSRKRSGLVNGLNQLDTEIKTNTRDLEEAMKTDPQDVPEDENEARNVNEAPTPRPTFKGILHPAEDVKRRVAPKTEIIEGSFENYYGTP